MANNRDSTYKLFSESNDHIGAECPECGRVLKIPKGRATESAGGFAVPDGIVCPCGQEASGGLQTHAGALRWRGVVLPVRL